MEMVCALVGILYQHYLRHRSSCRCIPDGTGSHRHDPGAGSIPRRHHRHRQRQQGVNGGGRIVWSSISDWIGRSVTYMVFFLFEVFAFHQLSITREGFIFQALVLAIISCYGGGFSCMPAFLSDIFGVRQLASIHGSILTAWGIAGVAGPLILAFMKETTGSYSATLQLFAGMLAVAFVISTVLHWRNEVDKKRYVMEEASKDSISNMAEAH